MTRITYTLAGPTGESAISEARPVYHLNEQNQWPHVVGHECMMGCAVAELAHVAGLWPVLVMNDRRWQLPERVTRSLTVAVSFPESVQPQAMYLLQGMRSTCISILSTFVLAQRKVSPTYRSFMPASFRDSTAL
jgi:hypothetical protein